MTDLKSAGYRLTQSRAAVVRIIDEADGWLRPEQVHSQAKKYCPSIGLVTVYRTLALLVEHGYIRRIHFDDKCHGYARVELSHGHHLVCRGCKQTIEIAGSLSWSVYAASASTFRHDHTTVMGDRVMQTTHIQKSGLKIHPSLFAMYTQIEGL